MKKFSDIRETTEIPSLKGVRVDLEKLKTKLIGKEYTPQKITDMFSKVGSKHSFDVNFITSSVVDLGQMLVNAYFDPEEDAIEEIAIEIELVFNNKDKTIVLSEEGFQWLIRTVLASLTHEMIHQKQYRSRGGIRGREFTKFNSDSKDVQKAQEYLGNTDEVEAYGFNIADQLMRSTKDYNKALDVLRGGAKDSLKYSPDLFAYIVAFGGSVNHPIIKRLLKKTTFYLNKIKNKYN